MGDFDGVLSHAASRGWAVPRAAQGGAEAADGFETVLLAPKAGAPWASAELWNAHAGAVAVAGFRRASTQAAPLPSAELLARLDADRVAAGSISFDPNATTAATSATPMPSSPGTRRRRVAFTGFAGLGLAAKIAIGAVAATAAGVTGAGAAGAGVLPAPAQEVFDGIVGQQEPGGEHISDSGREHREFGQEAAEDGAANGEEHKQAGQEVAGDATSTGDERSGAGEATADDARDGAPSPTSRATND